MRLTTMRSNAVAVRCGQNISILLSSRVLGWSGGTNDVAIEMRGSAVETYTAVALILRQRRLLGAVDGGVVG